MNISEKIWEKAEQNQVRRERLCLIRKGTISQKSVPNVMVKDADENKWKFPSLQTA